MKARSNITKRHVRQKNREGKVFEYDRYFLHYRNPSSGQRVNRRFDTRREAEAAQAKLLQEWEVLGRRNSREPPTMKEAVEHWLDCKKRSTQKSTHHAYAQVVRECILGPFLVGNQVDKARFAVTGRLPATLRLVPMLGPALKIDDISTAEIRKWLHRLGEMTTPYMVKVARKHLAAIFRLIEEDYEVRLARIPSRSGPSYRRKNRALLTEEQARLVIEEAQRDQKWGVYYAFLLLTGVRPSEMLGLRWSEVNLEQRHVRICRVQNSDGTFKDCPKTEAGNRAIPLNSVLLRLLTEWRERCPRQNGKLYRVFPAQAGDDGRGRRPTEESDGALLLSNFRNRVWYPMLERLGLPKISLYAARHMAISFLQAQGVEIGLVAKIAGHSSPQVTLQYYTHAVRDYEGVMDQLNAAYGVKDLTTCCEAAGSNASE